MNKITDKNYFIVAKQAIEKMYKDGKIDEASFWKAVITEYDKHYFEMRELWKQLMDEKEEENLKLADLLNLNSGIV